MTHNELLTKIEDKFNNHTGLHDAQIVNSLYRVVELHKPYGIDEWPNIKSYCEHCEHLQSEIWPCKTIQAIEKELG
jgi:hypothetical protein